MLDVGNYHLYVATGDFNKGDKLDIVNTNYKSYIISILLGNSNCTSQDAISYAVGANPSGITVGDFNNDGGLDIKL
ncbi:MAG: VCBS repeat-containing protein [Candidatus Midichloria sp.]|nr:MAG: VCBS repeat-containing protein [Candidatus Midichloria sp.]